LNRRPGSAPNGQTAAWHLLNLIRQSRLSCNREGDAGRRKNRADTWGILGVVQNVGGPVSKSTVTVKVAGPPQLMPRISSVYSPGCRMLMFGTEYLIGAATVPPPNLKSNSSTLADPPDGTARPISWLSHCVTSMFLRIAISISLVSFPGFLTRRGDILEPRQPDSTDSGQLNYRNNQIFNIS
jgi:hypothetical protein